MFSSGFQFSLMLLYFSFQLEIHRNHYYFREGGDSREKEERRAEMR